MSSNDEIEMVYIQDNPMLRIKDEDRPKGSFFFLPMRTTADKIWYGTGTAYFAGLAYGGVYGTIRGLQTAPVPLLKVRFNSVLNQTTRYGPWAANSLGVMSMFYLIVAMAYTCIDSIFEAIRGKSDYGNHVAAAFTAGFVFKSTAGLRPAVLTGAILSSVVGGYGLFGYLGSKKTVVAEPKLSMLAEKI
ncbi:Mitochondrial import inner membrane translocase subunit tim23 [Boothiomyces sp. JEL0838]|nr:Mitochondrial import inner membrane translocase subunit tim23 [Boothiomyces sp. JEL0838]